MKTASRNKVAAILSVLLALAIVSSPAFAAPPISSGVAPIDSRPYGKSYEQWASEWWEWAYESPIASNPQFSQVACASAQKDVWFLYGRFKEADPFERVCNVPANTALFFPLANLGYSSWQADLKEMKKKEFLLNFIDCNKTTAQAQVLIDGVSVPNAETYFVDTHFFNDVKDVAHINEVMGYGDQKWKTSVDSGTYMFLYPMSPGTHTVSWTAFLSCNVNWPGAPEPQVVDISQSMSYQINVAP